MPTAALVSVYSMLLRCQSSTVAGVTTAVNHMPRVLAPRRAPALRQELTKYAAFSSSVIHYLAFNS